MGNDGASLRRGGCELSCAAAAPPPNASARSLLIPRPPSFPPLLGKSNHDVNGTGHDHPQGERGGGRQCPADRRNLPRIVTTPFYPVIYRRSLNVMAWNMHPSAVLK